MIVLIAVLGRDDEVFGGILNDGLQADEGRGDPDVDPVIHGEADHVSTSEGEFLRLGGGLVHLPVAEKELFPSHGYLPSAMTSIPGRWPSY